MIRSVSIKHHRNVNAGLPRYTKKVELTKLHSDSNHSKIETPECVAETGLYSTTTYLHYKL